MKYSAKIYAEALLMALTDTAPKDYDVIIANLVENLKRNQDLPLYPKVIEEYERLSTKAEGIKDVHVTVANEGSSEREVIEALNKIGHTKVHSTTTVDPDIMGGVIIRTDDTLIDASVRTALDSLKDSMIK